MRVHGFSPLPEGRFVNFPKGNLITCFVNDESERIGLLFGFCYLVFVGGFICLCGSRFRGPWL